MRVVADAGPLIHLSWVNQLGVLGRLFEEVLVPPAVRDEVLAPPANALGLDNLHGAFTAGLLRVRRLARSNPALPEAVEALDVGEVEAVLLAIESEADLLITDDAAARAEAARHGLQVAGSIGVLIQARSEGLIPAALPLILELRRLGQWMSDELVALVEEEERRENG